MPELALLLALALIAVTWRAGQGRPAARVAVLAINLGFAFWYWLPAANVLLFHYQGAGSLPVADWSARQAVWIVIGYHAATLAVLLIAARLLPADAAQDAAPGAAEPPPRWLAAAVLASSLALVFMRFDPRLALRILAGVESARDHLTFFNRSSGWREALLKLLEILNLWTGLFVLGWAARSRALLGGTAVLAAASIVTGFIGSGARSDILMALFAITAGLSLRTAAPRRRAARRPWLPAAAIVLLAGLAAAALAARFRSGPGPLHALANSLLVNNDMFSETAFVLEKFRGFAPASVADFLMTPVTFLMPHGLGFTKAVPEHLILFNRVRAGIDIVNGQGNVFPGIVGDFVMVFGALPGMAVFAALIALYAVATTALAKAIPGAGPRLAWLAAMGAFLAVSIRNTQGSLMLVMLFGLAVAWTVIFVRRRA